MRDLSAEQVTRGLGRELGRPGAHTGLQTLARAGLVSRAVIYVVLGALAALIVGDGRPPSQASGTGALAEIAKQPAGPFLLGLLAAGLLCYGAWRLVQAVTGVEPATRGAPSMSTRGGWLAIAAVYFLLCADALSIIAGSGASGGPANHPQGAAATVLSWPGGAIVLGLAGAALAVGGATLGIWGCVHDYTRMLDMRRTPSWVRRASRLAGIAGNLTRAALVAMVAMVAAYTFVVAIDDSPTWEKSLDQSLEAVLRAPGGPWWIALVATGLVVYASYCLVEALYRRV